MSAYKSTKARLQKAGFCTQELEKIAGDIANASSSAKAESIYQTFVIEADKLPWMWDQDFGALVLQKQASNAASSISAFMISKAIDRARWCTQCASAGGEALARAVHLRELEAELEKYTA